jgi:hypothetical protein
VRTAVKDKKHFWVALDLQCLALPAVLTERIVCNIYNIVLQPTSCADFAAREKKKEHGRLSRGRNEDDGKTV